MGSACQFGASAKADAFIFSKTLLNTNILQIYTRTFFYFMHARAQKRCARTRMFNISDSLPDNIILSQNLHYDLHLRGCHFIVRWGSWPYYRTP